MPESPSGIIYFATANPHKVQEIQQLLKGQRITVKILPVKTVEIQSDDLREVAKYALKIAMKSPKRPIFVEDAGLFIDKLNGFPGPYSSYVYRTLGVQGVLRLLQGEVDRAAQFRSAIALAERNGTIEVFEGTANGRISDTPRGNRGFGFDPIFVPNGSSVTFAEMPLRLKNTYSHRGHSTRKMLRWFLSREQSLR